MNRSMPTLMGALALLVAVAAIGQANQGDETTDIGAPNTAADDARSVGLFSLDVSKLGAPPPPLLPANPLTLEDLTAASITDRLLQVPEAFVLTEVAVGREFYESPGWTLQRDAEDGATLALRKPVEVVAQPQNEAALRQASLQRLATFGIGPDQVLSLLQRRLMRQDELAGQIEPPAIHRYKTFVKRGLNGIEVEGHRAVVTHHLDGSLHRVWLNWPALASAGHRLRTNVSENIIVASTYRALRRAGESAGTARLRWKYVPTLLPSGEVQLELMVGARFRRAADGPESGEPREIDVSVFAY